MSMAKFDDFRSEVTKGAGALAKDLFKGYRTQAVKDTRQFLKASQEDLRRWTKQLANGELSKTEFKDLVRGQKDLAELAALTSAGIATTTLERFRTGLLTLLTDSAFKIFLPG